VLRDVGAGRDAVVIDSPPVLSVSDSLWLVRHVDSLGIDENPVVHTLTVLLRNDEGPAIRRPFVSFGSCVL